MLPRQTPPWMSCARRPRGQYRSRGDTSAARDRWLSPSVLIPLANGGRPLRDGMRRLTRGYHAQKRTEAEGVVEAVEE
jgi:hypothetical protein